MYLRWEFDSGCFEHTRQDRIWKEWIREKIGIAPVVENLLEYSLGGFDMDREDLLEL